MYLDYHLLLYLYKGLHFQGMNNCYKDSHPVNSSYEVEQLYHYF